MTKKKQRKANRVSDLKANEHRNCLSAAVTQEEANSCSQFLGSTQVTGSGTPGKKIIQAKGQFQEQWPLPLRNTSLLHYEGEMEGLGQGCRLWHLPLPRKEQTHCWRECYSPPGHVPPLPEGTKSRLLLLSHSHWGVE